MDKSQWRAYCTLVFLIAFGAFSMAVQAASTDPMYRLTDVGSLGGTCAIYGDAINATGQIMGTDCDVYLWGDDGKPMVDISPAGSEASPWAMNSAGQVTGWASNGFGDQAFVWKNDGTPPLFLTTLGGSSSEGVAINDAGQIAGNAAPGTGRKTHAVIWRYTGGPILDLGTLGGTWSTAYAQNASGQVTGFAYTAGNAQRAFLWKNDGTRMVGLGTLGGDRSEGLLINASGQVAGDSRVRKGLTDDHAFLWRNDGTAMLDLGTLGGTESYPFAMNDSGQVVGYSSPATGPAHAFAWMNDGKPMIDLGAMGGADTYAYGINSSGWVVGHANTNNGAFLWRNDGNGMRNLNDLIDPTDPLKPYVVLYWAADINDAGDIVADGTDSRTGAYRTYLVRGSSLALNPRALAFGNHKVGSTSASQSITIQNNSTSAVPITSVALTGSNANQFSQTNNCGSSVVAKGSCVIKAMFKPTAKGAKLATLTVNGGGGGLRVVNLSGTGT
jgi:probable HAF family extracellular repeat protein